MGVAGMGVRGKNDSGIAGYPKTRIPPVQLLSPFQKPSTTVKFHRTCDRQVEERFHLPLAKKKYYHQGNRSEA
jgi:hypothetical protein